MLRSCRWPSEDGKGGIVTTAVGEQLVDVYVFKPYLYRSGGLWLDEDLEVCLPLHVTFYETEAADKKGWAIPDADAEREDGVVLLYPQNRYPSPPSTLTVSLGTPGRFLCTDLRCTGQTRRRPHYAWQPLDWSLVATSSWM